MVDYTFVYSSECVEALKKLFKEMSKVFDIEESFDNLFYYGVFCKDITYANFKYWEEAPIDLDIPFNLTNPCSTQESRLEYVHITMDEVMRGEIEKPEWMIHVEMEDTCNEYEMSPSTFLYLTAKDEKYVNLGERLIEFLYSPNLVITMVRG